MKKVQNNPVDIKIAKKILGSFNDTRTSYERQLQNLKEALKVQSSIGI